MIYLIQNRILPDTARITKLKTKNIFVSGFKTAGTFTNDSSLLKPEIKTFLVLRKVFFYRWWLLQKNVLFTRAIKCL